MNNYVLETLIRERMRKLSDEVDWHGCSTSLERRSMTRLGLSAPDAPSSDSQLVSCSVTN
jgi:hypothetical protein